MVIAPVGTNGEGEPRSFRATELRIELAVALGQELDEKPPTFDQPNWLSETYDNESTILGCPPPSGSSVLTIQGDLYWDTDSYLPMMSEDGQTTIPDDVEPGVQIVVLRDGEPFLATWIGSEEQSVAENEEVIDALTVDLLPDVGLVPNEPAADRFDRFSCSIAMPPELLALEGTERLIAFPGIDARRSSSGIDVIESPSLLSLSLPTNGSYDAPGITESLAAARVGNSFYWVTTSQRPPALVAVRYRGDEQKQLTMQFLAGVLAGIAASVVVQAIWERTAMKDEGQVDES